MGVERVAGAVARGAGRRTRADPDFFEAIIAVVPRPAAPTAAPTAEVTPPAEP